MRLFGKLWIYVLAAALAVFVLRCGSTTPVVVPGPSVSPTATPTQAAGKKARSSTAAATVPSPCASKQIQVNYGIPPAGVFQAPLESVIYTCVSTGETATLRGIQIAGARLDVLMNTWPDPFIADVAVVASTPVPVFVSRFHAGDRVAVANGPYLRSGPGYGFAVIGTAPDGVATIVENCRLGGAMGFCHVRYASTLDGWTADEHQYLELAAAAPTATHVPPTPTPTVAPTKVPTLTDHERLIRLERAVFPGVTPVP